MSQNQPENLIIEVNDLWKNYGSVQALKGGSFQVSQGEIIALLGPNGAGKTTIMKILTGFMEPTSGEVKINGLGLESHLHEVQNLIGYLPENAPIYGEMLVQEYLVFVAQLRGLTDDVLLDRISEAVNNTGLQEVLTRSIGELSKGFKQRVGLAQAILHRPKLLILDEPTNGLDPTQILEIRHLIKRLAKNSTVMLSTHILSEAEATCDRAIIVIDGEIKADANLVDLSKGSQVTLTLQVPKDTHVKDIQKDLEGISGVQEVNWEKESAAFVRFHLLGREDAGSSLELASKVFERAKISGWKLCELRPESKTLETVFKELVIPSSKNDLTPFTKVQTG